MVTSQPSLLEITKLFLKLGFVAFGGPAAHISMFEEEVVEKRRWLDREHFLDLLGATNLIPGPNSTEMAIHIGYIVRGWRGLILAGACFICPAAAMIMVLAQLYVRYGELPEMASSLAGIKVAVVAIILSALLRLSRTVFKNISLAVLALAVAIAALLGGNEILLILTGGLVGMLWLNLSQRSASLLPGIFLPWLLTPGLATTSTTLTAVSLWKLGFFFLKVGSVLFGTGYVLIAFLQGGLVNDYGWLTERQLLDAIAAGQLTPGPLLATATFIGFLLKGWGGAVVATVAIFLPSFLFVLALNPIIPRLRRSPWSAAFLDAVNASAVALMAAVVIELGQATLVDWQTWSIFLLATILAVKFKIGGPWLVLGGAIAGYFLL
jgi:chromate transporter